MINHQREKQESSDERVGVVTFRESRVYTGRLLIYLNCTNVIHEQPFDLVLHLLLIRVEHLSLQPPEKSTQMFTINQVNIFPLRATTMTRQFDNMLKEHCYLNKYYKCN